MDVSRAVLDNLMGRDRNKPTDTITQRDHYSNPDVCKSFLVCFCFNTLFPNTTYDEGPCQKRHDTYLKTMFDSDPNRAQYQREYIRQCIHWIQRRLQQVQKKTKQNQSVIDNKSNFPADRPKQVLDRILAIQEDIQRLISQSQKYGQEGKIDDSARCLEQVQKLRDRRREIQLMGVDANSAQKQQKICLICGAIQTINDTEKRIQTHLQGKIHQGFLKLRHQVETLKIRLQVLNKLNPSDKKQKQEQQKRREQREKQRQRERQKERQKQKQKEREREKQNDRKREQNEKKTQKSTKQMVSQNNSKPIESRQNNDRQQRQRSESPSRRRRRSRSRQRRDGEKDRERRRDSRDRRSRSKDRKQRKHRDSRERENKQRNHKQKDHKKKSKKNRSRSKQRDDRKEREYREVY